MKKSAMMKLFSAYLDDAVTDEQRQRIEETLRTSPEAQRMFAELKQTRHILQNQPRLEPSPFFWSRLSHRLEFDSEKLFGDSFLPVPRKFIPALAVTCIIAVAIFTAIILKNNGHINEYVAEHAKTVKSFYESTLNTTLFPFLSDVSKDDVFTFAVGGYVPVDNSDDVLEFGNSPEKKYWVKVKKASEAPAMRIDDFYSAVSAKPEQKQKIEAVLEKYKPDLECCILLTNCDTMAIASRVWDMNNAIIFEMACHLDKAQRKEFEQWVAARNPDMPVRFNDVNFRRAEQLAERAHHLTERTAKLQDLKSFVFVTPDTTCMKNFSLKPQLTVISHSHHPQSVTATPLPPSAKRAFVVKKGERGNTFAFRFESSSEAPQTGDAPFVLSIDIPDFDFVFPEEEQYKLRDSLVKQLRHIRIPKPVMRMVTHEIPRIAEESAMKVTQESMEHVRRALNMKREAEKAVRAAQRYYYENRVTVAPKPPRIPQFHLSMIVDSVMSLSMKMSNLEKEMQIKEFKIDSLARVFEKHYKRDWKESIHNVTLDDSVVTIVTPDSQVIRVKRKDVRR